MRSAYQLLERFLELGVNMIKLWSALRGVDRGLFVDAPWRIECVKRARAAGVRIVMVHVADPDVWFRTVYADGAKYGTKPEQYVRLEKMLNLFPDMTWIGAHMAGDPEHPDHLEALLEKYPHFYIDTSATKWQVREVSPAPRRHPRPGLPLSRSFLVRHRSGDTSRPGARALRQPLLVPAHPVGKHLGRAAAQSPIRITRRKKMAPTRRSCAAWACPRMWSRRCTTKMPNDFCESSGKVLSPRA